MDDLVPIDSVMPEAAPAGPLVPAPPEAAVAAAPEEDGPAVLHLVHVHNPLMPSSSREARDIEWVRFKTVAAYLEDYVGAAHEAMAVSLNGRVLSLVEREHVLPRAGDYLVISPAIEGATVFRTLAMVAVMAASIVVPAFLVYDVAAWSFVGSTAVAAMIGGAISIGGNLLINTYLGLTPSSKAQQPSWAFSGPQTTAQPGLVIPKGYGTFMGGGNIIDSFVDLEGTDQYINALVCYGFGPARSISGLQINGKDIGTYQNAQYFLRYGTNDQTPIQQFNRIVNGYPQEVQVTCSGGPVVIPGTGNLTQALQVDIMFATGVFYTTGDGNLVPCRVVYKVEYSVSGLNEWQPVLQPRTTQDIVVYHSDGTINYADTPSWCLIWNGAAPGSGIVIATDNGPHTPGDAQTVTQVVTTYEEDGSYSRNTMNFTGEWQPVDVTLNQFMVIDWMNGWIQYVNDTTEVCYNRTSIYGLAPGKYDVRVTKWGSGNADDTIYTGDYDSPRRGQEVWIHSVNEITYQDMSYPNMILVGVRALATNQLSGANISITAVIEHGLRTLDENILPAALQAYEEDNPACVAADAMLDPLYGGGAYPGILPTNIERFIDEWVAWAENNDTLLPDGNGNNIRMHVFNGIFDNEDNLWNQLQAIGRMSRACIVPMGRDYGVFVNAADVPVQMFSVGNIKQDSYQETWLALDDRADQIEVEFADSTRYYRTDNPIVYMSPEDQAAGAVVKNVRVRGTGITIPAQAWYFGQFLGVCNELLLRTGKFETDIDGIACRPGNRIILQHDVPQWGWGGRTLTNSTATTIYVDRNDLPWDGTTAYNVIVLFPSIQRYTGTVTSVASSVDGTGLVIGTNVGLSSFDNANRVTRAVINGQDCPILSASPSLILVTLPPGFTPAVGQTYTLYDTDVLETATVAGVAEGPNNTMVLTLGVGFTQAPADFSVYFYGQPGSQKIVTVTGIRKKSDFRAEIEWIDYDPNAYALSVPVVDLQISGGTFTGTVNFTFSGGGGSGAAATANLVGGVVESLELTPGQDYSSAPAVSSSEPSVTAVAIIGPVVGETSAQVTTSPGVTNLVGDEQFELQQNGSYLDYAALSWQNGTATEAVAIYGSYPGLATPKMLVRLTGRPTSWKYQIAPGVQWTFTVVGIDANNNYAAWTSAPNVQITGEGITQNLLLGSSFQSGYTYWNVNTRSGDTQAFALTDDGESTYTVAGSSLTAPQTLLSQVVAASKWSVGTLLMLSAYFETTGTPTGNLVADIAFYNSAGSILSTARAVLTMAGAAAGLTRVNTALTAVPTGTVQVAVRLLVDGSSLSLPVGTTLTASHCLLEVGQTGQVNPSVWADIDVKGNVLDVFQAGSSSSLRTQASTLPVATGNIAYATTPTSATLSWTGLVIAWPDGGYTYVQDGSLPAVTGLSASTEYWAFLYWDVVNAVIVAVPPSTAVGTPPTFGTAYDATADHACANDGRVRLTPGGMSFTTPATGTGSGTGGGTGTGGAPPIGCTLRGVMLQTAAGPLRNDWIKRDFDEAAARGEKVYLRAAAGHIEAIRSAEWIPVDHYYRIEAEGFTPFCASGSHTLFVEGEDRQRWVSEIPSGSRIATSRGFKPARITRVDRSGEVLRIELDGPTHEYLVVEGVLTHNYKINPTG